MKFFALIEDTKGAVRRVEFESQFDALAVLKAQVEAELCGNDEHLAERTPVRGGKSYPVIRRVA